MKKIDIWVSNGLVGCTRKWSIDVEDDCTQDEIDEMVDEAVRERLEWGWKLHSETE